MAGGGEGAEWKVVSGRRGDGEGGVKVREVLIGNDSE